MNSPSLVHELKQITAKVKLDASIRAREEAQAKQIRLEASRKAFYNTVVKGPWRKLVREAAQAGKNYICLDSYHEEDACGLDKYFTYQGFGFRIVYQKNEEWTDTNYLEISW